MKLSTAEIRKKFTEFFQQHQHILKPSSSLLPVGDDSLFFTNAGMVQFKNFFLGHDKSDSPRVTTVQRCLRASGKHNDLGNVGYTKRHHTFFEMLGNFSFGNYFKREAIHFSWLFLTKELQLVPQRLWITVHEKDQESIQLWQEEFTSSGKHAQGISTCGDQDNFWSMGNIGPCGFCSEIYYDHGPSLAGDPPGKGIEGERYIEIWNLVFMQFERDINGKVTPLPHPSIDTGMGLERIAAVMQGTDDNYEIDSFRILRHHFREIAQPLSPKFSPESSEFKLAEKIASDHIRAVTFLIADGILPANDGKGYVLRSIIRRAVYYLYRLKLKEACFYRLIPTVITLLTRAYPDAELDKKQGQIMDLVCQEEWRFLENLDRGIQTLNLELKNKQYLSGDLAFKLHDTYGVPFILTEEIALERGITLDKIGFEAIMAHQRQLSRNKLPHSGTKLLDTSIYTPTIFTGYHTLDEKGKIIGILKNQQGAKELLCGESGVIILDKSPFYAEAGGQVSDHGKLVQENNLFTVNQVQKQNGVYLHFGTMLKGMFRINDALRAQVEVKRRQAIRANHTATHLLHRALRDLLGEQATQRGSYVDDLRLRFDFIHNKALSPEDLATLERTINGQIQANLPVTTLITSLIEAKKLKVTALFNEKYGEEVRIVNIGEKYSQELCGGTHVDATGEIGFFKIIKETSIASGVRRIEALTGEQAVNSALNTQFLMDNISKILGENDLQKLPDLITNLIENKNRNELEIIRLQEQILRYTITRWLSSLSEPILIVEVEYTPLKRVWDLIKEQPFLGIAILYSRKLNQFRCVVGITKNLTMKFSARQILQDLLKNSSGRGGGREDLAEGGGEDLTSFVAQFPSLKKRLLHEISIS